LKSETVRFATFTKKPRASASSRSTEGFAEGTDLPRAKVAVKGEKPYGAQLPAVSGTRNDDKDFLDRTDNALRYRLTFSAGFLSGVWVQLLLNYSTRVLAAFLILVGGIALLFLMEMRTIASNSVRARFLSWIMLAKRLRRMTWERAIGSQWSLTLTLYTARL
jgi:hypothetical protein